MEPPIGYGSEASFHLPGVPIQKGRRLRVSGGRSWNNDLIDTSARPAALEAIPGYTVTQGSYDQSLSSRGLDPDHHRHRYRWDCAAMAA